MAHRSYEILLEMHQNVSIVSPHEFWSPAVYACVNFGVHFTSLRKAIYNLSTFCTATSFFNTIVLKRIKSCKMSKQHQTVTVCVQISFQREQFTSMHCAVPSFRLSSL